VFLDFLQKLEPWHWLILSLTLLGAEALGFNGFLLGASFAAFLVFIVSGIFSSISWVNQLVVFGIGTLLFSIAWWFYFHRFNQQTSHPKLNHRTDQMIGRTFKLNIDIGLGEGRVLIDDTLWRAFSDKPLEAGTLVEIIGAKGMVLFLEKAEDT